MLRAEGLPCSWRERGVPSLSRYSQGAGASSEGVVSGTTSIHPNTRHGHTSRKQPRTPEYRAWTAMRTRCYNPNYPQYADYGGRGVVVCEQWRNDFAAFYAYLGPRPSAIHSLDRHPDPVGNYEPGNVRWATPTEQSRNRRYCIFLTYRGERKQLDDWADQLGIRRNRVRDRLRRGWSVEQALETPRLNAPCPLTEDDLVDMRTVRALGGSVADIAKAYGVAGRTVYSIVNYRYRKTRAA